VISRRGASASELLYLASPAALAQLAPFREVFASQLKRRPGRWVLGAEFTESALIKADADVITAGLLLDLGLLFREGLNASLRLMSAKSFS
jgi:hypothetical protein